MRDMKTSEITNGPPLAGAHLSTAGGAWKVFERAREVGANCVQLFLKSNVQWSCPVVGPDAVERFRAARAASGMAAVVAHACYLVNVSTEDARLRQKSVEDLVCEAGYAAMYGIKHLVLHPGNHMGAGAEAGVANAARALVEVLARTDEGVHIAVETTAGSGTAVGASLAEVAAIIAAVEAGGGKARGARVGVCLDTAHLYAAGYDIAGAAGWRRVKAELKALGLLSRVAVIHANDSRAALGSRVDRHEHIGRGNIGEEAFARLMRDRDLRLVPKIIETPKGMKGGSAWDKVNIALLRRLAGK